MSTNKKDDQSLVISYLLLRKAIGVLGIALPFLLSIGGWIIFKTDLQTSISSYYYSGMRDVLVGTLIAFGVFLFSYEGYPGDAVFGKLASIFAIGVALFPTRPPGEVTCDQRIIGIFHLLFTAAFFTTLIYFSYFLFTLSDQEPPLPRKKYQRNIVYRSCGVFMALCLVGIVFDYSLPATTDWLGDQAVFWLETIAIIAFGVSWFTKGEAIAFLNDPNIPKK